MKSINPMGNVRIVRESDVVGLDKRATHPKNIREKTISVSAIKNARKSRGGSVFKFPAIDEKSVDSGGIKKASTEELLNLIENSRELQPIVSENLQEKRKISKAPRRMKENSNVKKKPNISPTPKSAIQRKESVLRKNPSASQSDRGDITESKHVKSVSMTMDELPAHADSTSDMHVHEIRIASCHVFLRPDAPRSDARQCYKVVRHDFCRNTSSNSGLVYLILARNCFSPETGPRYAKIAISRSGQSAYRFFQ